MYSRILIPTDGGEKAQRAIEIGLDQASRFEATVHALYVIDERFVLTEYDFPVEEAERAGEEALDHVFEVGQEVGVPVERHLRQGIPHDEILAAIDSYGVDLVVIGRRSRTGLDRLASLGTVTQRVVRHSPVTVMTVPA